MEPHAKTLPPLPFLIEGCGEGRYGGGGGGQSHHCMGTATIHPYPASRHCPPGRHIESRMGKVTKRSIDMVVDMVMVAGTTKGTAKDRPWAR